MFNVKPRANPRGFKRQQGVVLFMAMIALVAMMLAAVALVRSVDTANMVAGNIAMKQGALQEADKLMNEAFACLDKGGKLLGSGVSLANDHDTVCNYYASLQDDTEKPFGIPDILEEVTGAKNDTTGNTVTYVIERMCTAAGAWDPVNCMESPFGKAAKYTDRAEAALVPVQALYRISVKVKGPRGVTSYSQMVLNATP
jgi:type IV pilus assembly protein PilX